MSKQARYYQLDANDAIRGAFKKGMRRVLIELATGLGKTVIFVLIAMMAKAKGGRVLIIVNRNVLVTQALEELKLNGVFAQREQAEERALLTADIVVGSVQSMQGKWLLRWPRDHFKLVITDECHGSSARTFRVILDHFGTAYHIGVTATAERHDKKGLWKGYEDIVYRMPLNNWEDRKTGEVTIGGINDGWLVPFDFHDLECPVTLEEKLMGKATFAENEEVFDSAKYLPRLAECAAKESEGHKGLFFLPNCRQSNGFADLLIERGINARHIDSSYMTPAETKERLEWFANVKEGILCNAQLLTTGYNEPSITLLGMFRPYGSLTAYKQSLGRSTRPLASVDQFGGRDEANKRRELIANSSKPFAKIITPFWENGNHNLATPSALITDDEEERKAIDKKRAPGQQMDFAEMETQLKAKRMADKDEEMRKLAEKVANSQAKKHRGAVFIDDILKSKKYGDGASEAQYRFLYVLAKKDFRKEKLTKSQASRIIGRYKPEKAA